MFIRIQLIPRDVSFAEMVGENPIKVSQEIGLVARQFSKRKIIVLGPF